MSERQRYKGKSLERWCFGDTRQLKIVSRCYWSWQQICCLPQKMNYTSWHNPKKLTRHYKQTVLQFPTFRFSIFLLLCPSCRQTGSPIGRDSRLLLLFPQVSISLKKWGEERMQAEEKGWLLEGESEDNDTAVCRTVGHSEHTEEVKLLSSINPFCPVTAEVRF